MNKWTVYLAGMLCVLSAERALADCGGSSVKEVTQSYRAAQQYEKKGDKRAALGAYHAAQDYTCEANPVAADAAKRAAVLGKELGDAAKAKGNHEAAYDSYEQGGHFQSADQALLAWVQAEPDSVALYQRAYDHVAGRQTAFAKNNAGRIAVTGAYTLDPHLVSRVHAMPEQGLARALAAENTAFNEAFLAKQVAMIRSRPADPADMAGMMSWGNSYTAFRQQFPKEYMKDAQSALDLAKAWAHADRNVADAAPRLAGITQRANARVATLTQKYSGAPDLLGSSLDFLARTVDDFQQAEPRVKKIKSQAESLGDAALAKSNFQLAIDYFDVADAEAKEQRARSLMDAAVKARTQSMIDAGRRDAEAIRAQFSDPNKVAEMQRQAREAQRSLQESAAARKTPEAKKAKDDMAAELGM